jgi:hypothetical protein
MGFQFQIEIILAGIAIIGTGGIFFIIYKNKKIDDNFKQEI